MLERHALSRAATTLSYLDSGKDGPIVVLLHGLAGSARELEPTALALAPRFRTLLLDQRGHGHSERRPADTSRDAFVDDVIALIEAVSPEGAALVGQSMGAHTAMLVAARRPDLVSRMVLLEVSAGGAEATEIDQFFSSWAVPFASRVAAAAFLGDGPLARSWVDDLEERDDGLWPRFDPDVIQAISSGLVRERWAEWERVKCPTLLVYGDHGMFPDPTKAAMVARNQHAERLDLPDAGHDAHLERPAGWFSVLDEFLKRAEEP